MNKIQLSNISNYSNMQTVVMDSYVNEKIADFVNKHKLTVRTNTDWNDELRPRYKFDENIYEVLSEFGEIVQCYGNEIIVLSEKYESLINLMIGVIDNEEDEYGIQEGFTILSNDFKKLKKVKELLFDSIKKYRLNFDDQIILRMMWWYFDMKEGIETKELYSHYDDTIHSESYPYIEDIDEYIERFKNSSENVLLLKGDPGTGKSRFIRYLMSRLCEKDEGFYFTTSEEVISSNKIYLSALENRSHIVMEDIDFHLKSRKENNSVMYSLLNVSDGIYTNNNKIIISTNLSSVSNIDEAFMRPGRCFDVLDFRKLTLTEAYNLLYKLDPEFLKINYKLEDKLYTVAEIYSIVKNDGKVRNVDSTIKKSKVGFNIDCYNEPIVTKSIRR